MPLPDTIIMLLRECGITELQQRPVKGGVRRLGSDSEHLTAIEVMERGSTVVGLTLLMTLHPGNERRARLSGALMAAILDLVAPAWNARQGWLIGQLQTFARDRGRLLQTKQHAISKVLHGGTAVEVTFSPELNRVDFRVVIKPEKQTKEPARGRTALAA